jgi:phage-related protein
MTRKTRPVSWIKAALKEFQTFPEGARAICLAALTIAAEGGKADIAKPMHGAWAQACSRLRCRSVAMRSA